MESFTMDVCLKDSKTLLEYINLNEKQNEKQKNQRFAAALVATRKIYEAICAHILRTMYGDNPQNGEDASSLFTNRIIRPFMNNAAKRYSEEARQVLVNFLESYKTAYALCRLDYLDKIFSNDAKGISSTSMVGASSAMLRTTICPS